MIVEVPDNNIKEEKGDEGLQKKEIKKCEKKKKKSGNSTPKSVSQEGVVCKKEENDLPIEVCPPSNLSKKISKTRITYKQNVTLLGLSTVQGNLSANDKKRFWLNVTYYDAGSVKDGVQPREHVSKIKFGSKKDSYFSDTKNENDRVKMNLKLTGKLIPDEADYVPDDFPCSHYKNPLRPEFYELNVLNKGEDYRSNWKSLNNNLF